MLRFRRPAVAILVLLTFWPTLVLGQEKAGVVTTLEGSVTAARPALAQPVSLKFRDDVFLNDRITTGDRSLARMLLGGKAVVTVRERSVITITEVPGKSTIELASGKIGLAVAKERLGPGEQIEIKTPNAVGAVRGTVVVAEVTRPTAQAGGGVAAAVTSFYVLRGAIEARQLVPGTNTPVGSPIPVGTLQSFTRAGSAPPHVAAITPGQLSQITSGLTPSGLSAKGAPDQVVEDQLATAGGLADFVSGTTTTSLVFAPITGVDGCCPPLLQPQGSLVKLDNATVTQPDGGSLISIGPSPASTPAPQVFTGVQNLGADGLLTTGSFPSIDVPLFLAQNSILNAPDSTVLSVSVAGTLSSTGAVGLMNLDPTTVTAATIASISGTLNLAGPLLTDVRGTYTVGSDFVIVGGTVQPTTPDAAAAGLVFQGSNATVGGNLVSILAGGQVTLNGLLVQSADSVTDSDTKKTSLTIGDGAVLWIAAGTEEAPAGALTSGSAAGLLSFDPTTVTAATIANIGGTLNLAGPLLTDILGTHTVSGNFLNVSGALNQTGGPATLLLQGSQVTVGGNLVAIPGQASVSGLLLGTIPDGETETNVKLAVGGSLLALSGTLTSTAPGGVLFLDPTTVDAASVANISGTLRLAGPLLSDLAGTHNMAADFVTISGKIHGPSDLASALPALLVLNGTTVQRQAGVAGINLIIVTPTGTVSVDGLALEALNANLQLGTGTALMVAGTLTANSPDGVLRMDPTTVSAATLASIAGTLSLAGTLLTDFGGTHNVTGNLLGVSGTLQPTAPGAAAAGLVFLGSDVTAGVNLATISGQATLNGLLLGAAPNEGTNPKLQVVGGALLDLPGMLTSNAAAGVIFLEGATVNAASVANIAGTLKLSGPLLTAINGVHNISGDVLTVSGLLQAATPGAAAAGLVFVGSDVTVGGNLVRASNAVIELEGILADLGGTLTSTAASGLLSFDPTTVKAATIANVGGTLNLVGSLLTDAGGTFNVSGDFVTVSGTLTQTGVPTEGAPALMIFSDSTVNSGTDEGHTHFFQVNGGAVELARPLLLANASTLTQKGFAFLEVAGSAEVGAQLTGNSPNPFIKLTGGSLALGPGVYGAFIENAVVTLAGGFLKATGTTLSAAMDRPFIHLAGGGLATGAGAVLDLTGVNLNLGAWPVVNLTLGSALAVGAGGITLTSGSLTADALVLSDGSGNVVVVNGTILDLTSSTAELRAIYAATGEVNTDSIGIAPGAQPLFRLADSHLVLTGDNLVTITGSGTTDTPLVVATGNSSLKVSGALLALSGELTSSAAAGVFSLDPTTVTAATLASITGTLNLTAGPLLTDILGVYNVSGDFVSVGGTLQQNSAPAGSGLFTFTESTVNSGTDFAHTHFFRVDGGTATLAAPLVLATSSAITQRGFALIEAAAGGQLTGNSTGALVDLTGGSLTLGAGVHALFVDGGGTVNVAGGLFRAGGTTLSASTGVPFIQLANGSLATGAGPVLELVGTTLDLGNQPVVNAINGSMLTVGTGGGVKLTSATLKADALYIADGSGNHVTANGTIVDLNNSSVTLRVIGDDSNPDTATLNLLAGQPLFRLQGSNLTLTGPGESLVDRGADAGAIPTESGVGLIATGGSITIAGPLLDIRGVILTDSDPQVQLTNVSVNQSGGHLVEVLGPLPVTSSGGLLRVTGDSLTTDGSLLNVQSVNFTVNDQSDGANEGVVDLRAFGSLTLGAGAPVMRVSDATLTSNLPLLSLSDSSLTGLTGPAFTLTNSQVQLTDTILRLEGANTIASSGGLLYAGYGTSLSTAGASLLAIGANTTVTLTGDTPALFFDGASASAGLNFVAIGSSSGAGTAPVVSLGAQLLKAENEGVTPLILSSGGARSFVAIFDGAQVTKTGAAPFIEVVGSFADGVLLAAAGNIVSVSATTAGRPAPTRLTLSGSLIDAVNTRLQSGDPAALVRSGVFIGDGAIVTKTDTIPTPLISLDAVNAVLGGPVISVRRSPSADEPTTLDLGINPLLSAVNSSVSTSAPIGLGGGACCSGFFVGQGARLLGTGADALVQLSGTIFNAGSSNVSGGSFFNASHACSTCGDTFHATTLPATVSLGGGLLWAANSSITALFNLLSITDSSFASTGPDPLISLDNAQVTLGGIDPFTGSTAVARVLNLTTSGSLSLRGSLLDALDTSISSTRGAVGVFGGAVLTQALTSAPLIRLEHAVVTTTALGGHVVHVSGAGSQMSLSGSLIEALNGTMINAFGNLVRIADGGTLTSSGVAAAVSWTSGSFTGAPSGSVAGSSLLRIFSAAGQPNSTLTLLGGPYVAATSAVFSAPDAPTFNIADGARISSTTSQAFAQFASSVVTSGSDFFTVTNNTSFTSPGQPTTFGSGVAPIVNVNGTLVRATDGTTIVPAASFFALSNGATLTETANSGGQPPLFDIASSSVTSGRSMFVMFAGDGLAAPRLELPGPLVRAVNAQLNSGTPGTNAFTTIFVGDGAFLHRTDSSGAALVDLTDTSVTTAGNILTLRRSVSAWAHSRVDLGANPLLVAHGGTLTTANPNPGNATACCSTFFVGQGGELTSTFAGPLISLFSSTVNAGGNNVSGGNFFSVTDTGAFFTDTYNLTTLPSTVSLAGGLLLSQNSTVNALFSGLQITRSTFTAGPAGPLFQVADNGDRTWSLGGVSPLAFGTNPAGTESFASLVLVNAGVPTTGPLGDATLTLNNGLLSVTNTGGRTTFRTTGDFILVVNGASLVHTDSDPSLVFSSNATYDVRSNTNPTTASRFFLNVFGMGGASGTRPSTASVSGHLLDSNSDRFNIAASFLMTNPGGAIPSDLISLTQTAGTAALLAFHGSVLNLGAAAGGVPGAGNLAHVSGNTQMRLTGPLVFIDTLGAGPWSIDRFVLARCGAAFACSGVGTAGLETFTTEALVWLNGTPIANGVPAPHSLSQAMFDLAGVRTTVETDPDAVGLTVGTDQPLRHAGTLFRGGGIFEGVDKGTKISVANVLRMDTALLAATAPIVDLLNSQLTVQHHAIDLVNQAKLTVSMPLDAVFRLDASTLTIQGSSLANVSNSFMRVVGNLFALGNGSTLTLNDGALVTVSNGGVFRLTAGSLGFFGSGANLLHILATPGGGSIVTIAGIPVMLLHDASASQVVVAAGFVPFSGLGATNTVDIEAGAAALVVDGTTARIILGDFAAVTHLNIVNIVQNPNLHLGAGQTLDPQLANLVGLGEFSGGATLVKVQNASNVTQDAGGTLVLVPAGANVTLGGLLLEVSDSGVQAGNAVVRVDGVLSAGGLLRFDPASATATTMAEINGTVSLTGPLFTDVRGTFDISGDFVKVIGTLTTGTAAALLDFDRSAVQVGQAMLNLIGSGGNTGIDPDEGIEVGMDQPLRHGGVLVQGTDATVTTGQVTRLDTALLEATAPVVKLIRSAKTLQGHALDLVDRARLTAGTVSAPIDVFSLNASTLTLAAGASLANVSNSVLRIFGNLFSLNNTSTLTITNGALVTASGTGVFQLTGGSLGVFGATGTNTLNILATSGGGAFAAAGSIPNLDVAKVPVLLRNNATAGQVTVSPGFVPFSGVNGSNTVNIPTGSAALIVDGSAAKIKLGP
jgi:hypothetical protein